MQLNKMKFESHGSNLVRRILNIDFKNNWISYLFLMPFLIVYVIFLVYPLFSGFWISLHDQELMGEEHLFIGLLNYFDIFEDPTFWKVLRNTILFVAICVPLMTGLALFLALLTNKNGLVYDIMRSIFFASSILSVTVVTLVWIMILNPEKGLLANLFLAIGVTPINFITDSDLAMIALVLATLWWGVGLPMALFAASLKQIPTEIYEAAELDHASRIGILFKIILPAIKRTTVLVIIMQIVAQFQMFGQAYLITRGGPSNQTKPIVQYIYELGFRDWQVGYATAMAMLLFLIMLFFAMIQLWVGRQKD